MHKNLCRIFGKTLKLLYADFFKISTESSSSEDEKIVSWFSWDVINVGSKYSCSSNSIINRFQKNFVASFRF